MPCGWECQLRCPPGDFAHGGVVFTLSSGIDSSLCRGTTVTSSISQRKATSAGTRPEGMGRAIVDGGFEVLSLKLAFRGRRDWILGTRQ